MSRSDVSSVPCRVNSSGATSRDSLEGLTADETQTSTLCLPASTLSEVPAQDSARAQHG